MAKANANVFYPYVPNKEQIRRRTKGISLTEWLVVLVTGLSGLMFADPFYGGGLARTFIAKAVVFGLMTVTLLSHLIARATVAPVEFWASVRRVFSAFWPLVLLALFIIIGSMWGVRIDKITSPFMNFGLSMLYLPALAITIDSSDAPIEFLKRMAVVYVLTVLMMLGEMPFNRQSVHHEEIFIAVPLGMVFLTASRLTIWHIIAGLGLIAACGLSLKNTTYIMMVIALIVPMLIWLRKVTNIKDRLKALVFTLIAAVLALGALAAVGVAWYLLKHLLPNGNTEYREEMYRIAWNKFVDSPIWGTGFAGEAVTYFSLYTVDLSTQYLPTHSDILDILANGGLIGITLWFVTVIKIPQFFWMACSRLSQATPPANEMAWRWFMVLSVYQICAVVTYAVNPPLIMPIHGLFIWGGMGVTWALCRQLTKDDVKVLRRAKVWA